MNQMTNYVSDLTQLVRVCWIIFESDSSPTVFATKLQKAANFNSAISIITEIKIFLEFLQSQFKSEKIGKILEKRKKLMICGGKKAKNYEFPRGCELLKGKKNIGEQ